MPSAHAEVFGVAAEHAVVVDLVPRDVQRDARGERGHPVDLGGIRDLLERIARGAFGGPHPEAGAGVAERPRGQLDGLTLEGLLDVGGEDAHDASLSSCDGCRCKLVFEVEDLGQGSGGLVGAAAEADEEPAHLGFPPRGDGGCRQIGLRGRVVVGLVVADEPSALSEEERVVLPPGRRDLGEHLRPDGRVALDVLGEQLGGDLELEADACGGCHGCSSLRAGVAVGL